MSVNIGDISAVLVTSILCCTPVATQDTQETRQRALLGSNKVEPVTLSLLGLPKKGTYVVKEEIEKAPVHDHPCNLTDTVVRISFPEMASEVFMNLLGYKGSNMIHLQRCKGRCGDGSSPVQCSPTKIREKKVKMTVRSFLTGGTPKDQLKELILDDHVECGCECSPELMAECAGLFNPGTCECECTAWEYGEKKMLCEMTRDQYWDPGTCQCKGKMVQPRGVDLVGPECGQGKNNGALADFIIRTDDNRTAQMVLWVSLGASVTLVIVLAMTTQHYKGKMEKVTRHRKEERLNGNTNFKSLDEEPDFTARNLDYSDSLHSQNSVSDFPAPGAGMPRNPDSYKSSENLVQGMPSTQHVEIGGEVFFQYFHQHGEESGRQSYN